MRFSDVTVLPLESGYCSHSGSPLAGKKAITIEELAQYPLVTIPSALPDAQNWILPLTAQGYATYRLHGNGC